MKMKKKKKENGEQSLEEEEEEEAGISILSHPCFLTSFCFVGNIVIHQMASKLETSLELRVHSFWTGERKKWLNK